MDEVSKTKLKRILKKSLVELTHNDKAFIKARRDYLKPSQKADYKFLTQTLKRTVKQKHGKTQKTK